MITLADIQSARARVAPYVHRTPLVKNTTLSSLFHANVYLKLELFQKTGSFKPRAAFSKMLNLSEAERSRGAVAVSGGNFAQGVAYAANKLGLQATIFMPDHTPQNYLDATRGYGATVELVPDIQIAFDRAEEARQAGALFLHPYDDPEIVAGSGVIGLELLEDVPELTDVIMSVGGGGLMSGITLAVKALKPDVRVWSVETEGADCLAQAIKAGEPVRINPTSLAKTLGAPIASADALAVSQQYVARHLVVTDAEAYHAQRFLMERVKIFPELSAACTLAAAKKLRDQFSADTHLVLIICGGNVSLNDVALYKSKFE